MTSRFRFLALIPEDGYQLVNRRNYGLLLAPTTQFWDELEDLFEEVDGEFIERKEKSSEFDQLLRDNLRFIYIHYFPALFREFADTPTRPEGVRQFANKYGRLFSKGSSGGLLEAAFNSDNVKSWYPEIRRMKAAVIRWERSGVPAVSRILAKRKYGTSTVELIYNREAGTPELSLVPESLLDAMWIQFVEAVSRNAKLRKCGLCETWFEYGPGMGKRSTAQYCSKKCSDQHYNKFKWRTT